MNAITLTEVVTTEIHETSTTPISPDTTTPSPCKACSPEVCIVRQGSDGNNNYTCEKLCPGGYDLQKCAGKRMFSKHHFIKQSILLANY